MQKKNKLIRRKKKVVGFICFVSVFFYCFSGKINNDDDNDLYFNDLLKISEHMEHYINKVDFES